MAGDVGRPGRLDGRTAGALEGPLTVPAAVLVAIPVVAFAGRLSVPVGWAFDVAGRLGADAALRRTEAAPAPLVARHPEEPG